MVKHGHKLSKYVKLSSKRNKNGWENFSIKKSDPIWTAKRVLAGYKKIVAAVRPNTWGNSKNIYE